MDSRLKEEATSIKVPLFMAGDCQRALMRKRAGFVFQEAILKVIEKEGVSLRYLSQGPL